MAEDKVDPYRFWVPTAEDKVKAAEDYINQVQTIAEVWLSEDKSLLWFGDYGEYGRTTQALDKAEATDLAKAILELAEAMT